MPPCSAVLPKSKRSAGIVSIGMVLGPGLLTAQQDSSQFGFMSNEAASAGSFLDFFRPEVKSELPLKEDVVDANGLLLPDAESPPRETTPASEELKPERGSIIPDWLHLGLQAGALYDDNIFLSKDNAEGSLITRLTPIISASTLEATSAVWSLSAIYSPTWTAYADFSDLDSFDHAVSSLLKYNGPVLKSQARLSYIEVTGNDRYIQDVTTTATSQAEVLSSYELSGRTTLESRFLMQRTDREDIGTRIFNDEDTISLQISALWQATGLTRLGPSIQFGATDSTLSPDRTFTDFLLRVDYESSALLKFTGQGGAQLLSIEEGRGEYWRPSALFAAQYDPNPLWQVNLNAYSRSNPAPNVSNSDLQTTGFSGALLWKPADVIQVSAGGGYERATTEFFNGAPDRDSEYYFGEFRVKVGGPNSPFAVEVFYRHRLSKSNEDIEDFTNNQVGLQVSRSF